MAIDTHSIVARDTALCKSIHIDVITTPANGQCSVEAADASYRLGLASEFGEGEFEKKKNARKQLFLF
jgi:hypothetical protein